MGNPKNKKEAVALVATAFDLEAFKKLTPEEQADYVSKLHTSNGALTADAEFAREETEVAKREVEEQANRVITLQDVAEAAKKEAEVAKRVAEEQASQVKAAKKEVEAAKKEIKAAKEEAAKDLLPTFTIEETDRDLDINEGDEFEFTAPLLTWDDNSIIDIKALAKSKDGVDQELYQLICVSLIQRKSGLIRKK